MAHDDDATLLHPEQIDARRRSNRRALCGFIIGFLIVAGAAAGTTVGVIESRDHHTSDQNTTTSNTTSHPQYLSAVDEARAGHGMRRRLV
mmetsp:Transcript_25796/g.79575  ORF Transcript_25796/g.79575 Transcript_25796/m.79575 type:complete len:90 (+) Transcript_25796:26-295(+)